MCRASCIHDEMFNQRTARRELKKYRKRGPGASTRELLKGIESAALPVGSTILDIGGGVGAIHHRLLERGYARATQLDASSAFIAVASEEARKLGHESRVDLRVGDFHSVAGQVPLADVVTLDRVVCCDRDYESMLGEAAKHAHRLVALTYPRPRWSTRVFVGLGNTVLRLMGKSFRAFVHPPAAMARVLEDNGLRRRWAGGTFVWAAEIFER